MSNIKIIDARIKYVFDEYMVKIKFEKDGKKYINTTTTDSLGGYTEQEFLDECIGLVKEFE